MEDEQVRKHLPRMFSLIKNESLGDRRGLDTLVVLTINDTNTGETYQGPDIGRIDRTKLFLGFYGVVVHGRS